MKKQKIFKPTGFVIFVILCLFIFGSSAALGEEFNWRKHEGTTLRVLASKSLFTPIAVKNIKEFEADTGIKVQVEHNPSMQNRNRTLAFALLCALLLATGTLLALEGDLEKQEKFGGEIFKV